MGLGPRPRAEFSSARDLSLSRLGNRSLGHDEVVERDIQQFGDLAQRLNVAAFAPGFDLRKEALRDSGSFGERGLSQSGPFSVERERRFRGQQFIHFGAGQGMLALLASVQRAARSLGVRGIFGGGCDQLIVFLAGANHDVVALIVGSTVDQYRFGAMPWTRLNALPNALSEA
jgi:hypothetical protein